MKSSLTRFLWHYASSRVTGRRHPFLVQLVVTNRCNARCAYCYARYYERDYQDMPLDGMLGIVDDLVRAGMYRLNLVGGEPLVRKDLGNIIEHAQNRGVRCAMTTNGVLVPERMDLVRRLDTVCFSIDGCQENNDMNRGQRSFERAVAGMEACRSAGVKIQMSAVLSRHTVHDVDFLVDLARQYGCRVGFATLISQEREGRDAGPPDLAPSEEDLRKALEKIIEHKRQGAPILFSSASYQLAHNWPDYTKGLVLGDLQPAPAHPRCRAGSDFALVDYNGDIYPCPQLIGVFKPRNALHDGTEDALAHAAAHACRACPVPCSNEFNMFFGMDARVLKEQIAHWIKR